VGNDIHRAAPAPPGRLLPWVLLILGIAGAFALWYWHRGAESRALKQLPPDERSAVFARELENLKSLCGHSPPKEALQERCESLASFVLELPECDEACKALARSRLSRATR
jgi:hypothetical protein